MIITIRAICVIVLAIAKGEKFDSIESLAQYADELGELERVAKSK